MDKRSSGDCSRIVGKPWDYFMFARHSPTIGDTLAKHPNFLVEQ
jgi:hypothetical protein